MYCLILYAPGDVITADYSVTWHISPRLYGSEHPRVGDRSSQIESA
jgi:hypothetical protein